jgi:SagB-type dehydrogenase family enzyme
MPNFALSKLVWVMLPLILVGAVVGFLAWRARLPSRAVLNAAFSLLLTVYLLATAGLGIFWVANQHLPVFDWHYTFGYAMLILVVVHLGFNFRMLLHTFKRRKLVVRPAAPLPTGAAVPPRRPWLGALGLMGFLSLVGGAYWVGLRHGRTELRVVLGGAGTAPNQASAVVSAAEAAAQANLGVVQVFHEFSSHSRSGLFRRAASTDWGARPAPFKLIAGQQVLPLPPPLAGATPNMLLSLQGLHTLLWHTAGVRVEQGGVVFRTAPSSGALFAAEFYLAVRAQPTLPAGLWHYRADTQSLVLLQAGELDTTLLPEQAPAALVVTAIWRRSGHKYGDRTYRYVLADLGHALENLRQVAQALGGTATLLPRFDELALAERLRVAEVDEGVLAHVLLHPQPVVLVPGSGPVATPLASEKPQGLTHAVHLATSLRGSGMPPRLVPALDVLPLPHDPLPLIAARQSLRRYTKRALSQAALLQVLRAMDSPARQLSDAVRIHVVTQAVLGLEPAAWRWSGGTLQLSRSHGRDLRQRSRAAALDQDVMGDAAAVFVLGIDRATFAADPAGLARGYRHAFIEAGLVGERLYLQAQALGLGVCAVGAFYDDEALDLVAVDAQKEWLVHFAALGMTASGHTS